MDPSSQMKETLKKGYSFLKRKREKGREGGGGKRERKVFERFGGDEE